MSNDYFDKAKDAIKGHPDQAGGAIEKVEDFLNEKTGGKYAEQIDQAGDFLREQLGLPSDAAPQQPGPENPAEAPGADSEPEAPQQPTDPADVPQPDRAPADDQPGSEPTAENPDSPFQAPQGDDGEAKAPERMPSSDESTS